MPVIKTVIKPVIKPVIKAGTKRVTIAGSRTGRRKRRNWTPAEKARIVAESAEPGANISAVALGDQSRSSFGLATARGAGAGESGCGDDASPAVCANYDRGRGAAAQA
ncbi:transposase [Mesorhizobium sp.]|uniref:transposase n=1 Tax=Mesorhizobium sp. TaxID=1871066 RepID=UPI00258ABEE3|nr:transposase [Mesorhizobium sp.]